MPTKKKKKKTPRILSLIISIRSFLLIDRNNGTIRARDGVIVAGSGVIGSLLGLPECLFFFSPLYLHSNVSLSILLYSSLSLAVYYPSLLRILSACIHMTSATPPRPRLAPDIPPCRIRNAPLAYCWNP